VCFLPFEQLIEQQMVQLQDSILEHLHHHTLSNMLFDKISKAHRARILLCFGLGTNVWLTIQPISQPFDYLVKLFFTTLCRVNLSLGGTLGTSHPKNFQPIQLQDNIGFTFFLKKSFQFFHQKVTQIM